MFTITTKMRFFRRKADASLLLSKEDDSSTSLNSYQKDDRVSEVIFQSMTGNKKSNILTVSVDHVPALADDLITAKSTGSQKSMHALRKLFALSENALEETRKDMASDRTLVPNLLKFLDMCRAEGKAGQKPQLILALMILNNISIPVGSKRLVAIDHGGASFLCKLLSDEPSYGLVAIILVNLTFSNATLRHDLVTDSKNLLVVSLALAFRTATLTKEQYRTRRLPNGSLRERLQYLLAFDTLSDPPPPKHMQIYPDTARRCLSALQNLTRDPTTNSASRELMELNILPFISCFLIVTNKANTSFNSMSSSETPEPVDVGNDPFTQASKEADQTIQDVALFLLLNISSDPKVATYLRDNTGTIAILKNITEFSIVSDDVPIAAKLDAELHRLKARMTLALLLAAEGNFGQANSQCHLDIDHSSLEIDSADANCLLELLGNAIHRRSKDGPGGYKAVTFTLKTILRSLRCLVTVSSNVAYLASTVGLKLNSLLVQAIGMHSLQKSSVMCKEAAEDACFSLYLMSDFGFRSPFLPTNLGHGYGTRNVMAKVLTALVKAGGATSAARHAAQQILLRAKYLVIVEEVYSDFCFEGSLISDAKRYAIEHKIHSGAQPRDDIFDKPIENGGEVFDNVLQAVQTLSFGSTRVRHNSEIDDIQIANNLAQCANGMVRRSYGYSWNWTHNKASAKPNKPLSIFNMVLPNLCGADTTK